jgi:type II secretory pathway pseudopilin PulG
MGQRSRSGSRRSLSSRRLPLLVGTAALGAVGVSILAPSADAIDSSPENRQAALVLAEDSSAVASSAQGASAEAQAQARVQTLAAVQQAQQAAAQAPAASSFPATVDGYKAYAESKVGATQFACLDLLWTKESHWRTDAHNPSSSAYGIPQLLDSTWRVTGIGKTSDGFRQVDAGLVYLKRAYPAGPCSAWAHSRARGWY